MRELPILMNGAMVRAVLEGRKTVTRRVAKDEVKAFWTAHYNDAGERIYPNCPYGDVGDRLYVRETWGLFDPFPTLDTAEESMEVVYKVHHHGREPARWRPSIHMPKEYARIWLEVTAVRVERLQDVTEEQARAEGVQWWGPIAGDWRHASNSKLDALPGFMSLWDGLAKPGTRWADNPWVWVVEFTRLENVHG